MGKPEIPKEWQEGKVKPLMEIKDGENFHMIVQGSNPCDPSRGWRILSKQRKDGKIEAVMYFGTVTEDGTIKKKENIGDMLCKDAEEFNNKMTSLFTAVKEAFPTTEIRVLNLQGLTMEQAVNRLEESDFAYVWKVPQKEGGEEDGEKKHSSGA